MLHSTMQLGRIAAFRLPIAFLSKPWSFFARKILVSYEKEYVYGEASVRFSV